MFIMTGLPNSLYGSKNNDNRKLGSVSSVKPVVLRSFTLHSS